METKNQDQRKLGVSIIVCTNKVGMMDNIFSNYDQQMWKDKEMIIVLNKDSLQIDKWRKRAAQSYQVSVYQLPQRLTLGACLNYGISKGQFDHFAKFDDDDYYGPAYLTEAMKAFQRTNADVVGKLTAFMYLERTKQLRLRYPRKENRRVRKVLGGTIIAKQKVFQKVRFLNRSLAEDTTFLKNCRRKGFKIYSTSRFNYTYLRRINGKHTWKPRKSYLMRTSRRICQTNDFRRYADKYISRKQRFNKTF